MPEMKTRAWKLGGKFSDFTGLLNSTYVVQKGVVQYAADKTPKVLVQNYGATPMDGGTVDASRAAIEAEMRIKVEGEIRAKMAAEAQVKAEAEAKAKAEAEAKAKAEAEAKAKAEAEAKAKAEAAKKP